MKETYLIYLCLSCFIYSADSFASPFSDIWSVSKTFADGGFEGDVKVTVFEATRGSWKLSINFDRPVKGLQLWTGKISDVGRDFTYYVIENQAWNGNLYAGSKLEFHILGYSQNGLPSLTIDFQGHVLGLSKGKEITPLEVDNNFQVDHNYVLASSLRFFESQKSGTLPKDNVVFWKQSSGTYDGGAEGVDLNGGFYISGDYVKFGFPMAFAMTQLAWGGLRYAQGYERAQESANLLKVLKWGSDYFLKAHVQDNEFYGMSHFRGLNLWLRKCDFELAGTISPDNIQVGDPSIEHGEWESGSNMNWRRPAYKLTPTDPGSDLVGETVAALCSTAMLFNSLLAGVDQQYSKALIDHAEKLYYFADMNRGRYDAFSIPTAKNFYPSTGYGDELAWAAVWLYRATNNQAYMDQALIKYDEFKLAEVKTEKGVDYDNKVLALQLMLAEVTGDSAKFFVPVRRFCDFWSGPKATFTPDGILGMQGIKYPNKFSANTAFLCLMASDFASDDARKTSYRKLATEQIEELLGKDSGTSYMVGYGDDFPKFVHDRDSSCPTPPDSCGWGFFKSSKPNSNTLIGAVVGGPGSTGKFEDSRKNFIGNQPSILINSAFQSAVAGVSLFFVQPGEVIPSMDPHIAANIIFDAENTPKFDACISDPCDNDGVCSNIAGLNYLCDCPDNVFGRNCEHRLVPVLKVTNTWPNGAELKLTLPNVKPDGAWQLRIIFPPDCPLTDADIWNACLNVRDSNLQKSEMFMQQIGWQNNLDFIGIKFQFLSPVYFRNCLKEDAFRFVIVEEAAPWLGRFSPDDCPRGLPHEFEGGSGGGSGFRSFEGSGGFGGSGGSGDFDVFTVPQQTTTVNYYQTPVPQATQPYQPPALPPTTTTSYIAPSQPPLTNQPLPAGQQPKPIFTELLPHIEWMTQWGSGGQGHIQIRDSRPNEQGRWLLGMIVPPECVINTFQFWGACTADSLSNPTGGHFVFEQIDWQVNQDFIGFTVHFHLANGIYAPECFKDSSYAFSYLESYAPYNLDVNRCIKEYKGLNPDSSVEARSFSLKADPNADPNDAPNEPSSIIDPNNQWVAQETVPILPNVNNLQAIYVSDSAVEIQWNSLQPEVDYLRMSYSPIATDGVYFKNADIDQQYLAALYQSIDVAKDKTSVVMNNLEPGTNYQFEARNMNALSEGAPSSIYLTTTPLDVKDLRAVSLSGHSVEISWQIPKGFHEKYKVTYFPQSLSGNPKSPFYLSDSETRAVVDGLTQNTDFIFSIVTQSGTASSDGIYTYIQTIINQCSPTTCSGVNEVCENQPSGPACNCVRGYFGNPCTDINECATGDDICHAEAICQNTPGSHTCNCKLGYTGDGISCFDVNECAQSICPNACLNTVGSFQCICPIGTNGDGFTCTDINECLLGTSNCPPSTSCLNTDGSFTCFCEAGYNLVGTECVDIDECLLGTHDCNPSTICANKPGHFDCNCDKSYEKVNEICIDIDECVRGTHDCSIHATCTNLIGAFACICNPGFIGDGRICTDEDECAVGSHTCHPTTLCANNLGGFDCVCTAGFEKIGVACSDINECGIGTDDCSVQSTCTNLPGTFTCSCVDGYQGNGKTCTDINECVVGTHGCSANAICSNLIGSHTCTCSAGFVGDGFTCTPITTAVPLTDECSLATHDCDVNAACFDTVGSFTCTCRAGFTGDGKTCVDIDECSAGPITAICPGLNRICTNTPGTFNCECATGYQDDGNGTNTCVDVDECLLNSDDCHTLAVCMNVPGTFNCVCATGFTGDGKLCTDADECLAVNNCDSNADCTNSFGSYACDCKVGFTGDGITCSDVDECVLGFCALNSICNNMPGLFTCACQAGYTGDGLVFCDDIDECLNPNTCNVNAQCTNSNGSFDCVCNAGFTGDGQTCSSSYSCDCEIGFQGNGTQCEDLNECIVGNPCHGDAECSNLIGSHSCVCRDGYQGNGTRCDDVNECIGDHGCHDDAECSNLIGSHSCECRDGYQGNGTHCDDVNECIGDHGCHDDAECSNLIGSHSCVCRDGYQGNGTRCDDVNECNGDHGCHDDAECSNLIGSHSCVCRDGYQGNGTRCDDVNECNGDHGCHDDADCSNLIGSHSCVCRDGYQGNGTRCDDVNECNGDHGCHDDADCSNLIGSHSCVCRDGYQGNGTRCYDVNECLSVHGCHVDAQCLNEVGSYACECGSGYEGDGLSCNDTNECDSFPCSRNGNCSNTKGSFDCYCDHGYSGDGFNCDDINECLDSNANICHKSAECLNTIGAYECSCYSGFIGDGFNCDDIDECSNGQHKCNIRTSTCVNFPGGYNCDCLSGYRSTGESYIMNCQDLDECYYNEHNCDRNAFCTNTIGSFNCRCKKYYEGDGKSCHALVDPLICQPKDIVFLVDRTSTPFVFGKALEFVKNISFPLNLGQGKVQVGVATFYSKTFKSIYLRNGRSFAAIDSALRKTRVSGTKLNARREIGSAMRWVRERFLIPSQGKSRDKVPTSVVVISSGPSHDIIFNELLTYDSLDIDLTFVLTGEKTSLSNSTNSRTLRTINIVEAPSVYNLVDHVDEMKLHLCPSELKSGMVKRREMALTPYSHPDKCPSKASFDILFVVDSRTKVDKSDLEFTKTFMKKIIQQFPIGINGTRIGIIQFALKAKTLIYLDYGTNEIIVDTAINNMEELGKGQQVGNALSLARYVNFHPLVGRREDHPGVVVLLTGSKGATTDEEFQFWRKSFRSAGAAVITVTLGSSKPEQLRLLSGESTVRVEKYNELLPKAYPSVLREICKV